MVKEEFIRDNTLIRHYSDENFLIKQHETEILYSEAVDTVPCRYTYEETDIPIGEEDPEATEEDLLSALDTLGVHDEEENT